MSEIPHISVQLSNALNETGVSERELAHRLVPGRDRRKAENKRRYLRKVLDGDVDRPGALRKWETALGLPRGYFTVANRAQRRATAVTLTSLESRLEELAETLEDSLKAQKTMRGQIARLQSRIRTLEAQPAGSEAGPTHPQTAGERT